MGNGLLAQWRRRMVARGLAGAALFAVPVAVAAAIGFGTSLSGVAGGLSAVTSGPDAVPASAQTGSRNLNKTVAALNPKPSPSSQSTGTSGGGGDSGGNSLPSGGGSVGGGGSGGSSGSGGSGGGSGSTPLPTITAPSAPGVPLPGGGSTSDTTDQIDGAVNNLLGGVDQTVNGLLGQ
jgi:hypothetical protein